jgi:putative addiction module component (TIGR02574 family)
MTKAAVAELLKLRPEERLEIAQLLWESVEPEEEAHFLSIPEWQREVLKERLEDLEHHPDDEQPWEEVKAELWPGA